MTDRGGMRRSCGFRGGRQTSAEQENDDENGGGEKDDGEPTEGTRIHDGPPAGAARRLGR